jgi:hypothetical protein
MPACYAVVSKTEKDVTLVAVLRDSVATWSGSGARNGAGNALCRRRSRSKRVAWIGQVTPEAIASELADRERIAPLTMFNVLRMQMDELGFVTDYRVCALCELPKVVFRAASRLETIVSRKTGAPATLSPSKVAYVPIADVRWALPQTAASRAFGNLGACPSDA